MKKLENKAEYLPLSELVKLENNPRTIKKADFEKLKTSIKSNPDYFEARPIICSDRTGGTDVDTGATNRKLGSDMGRAVTGGGLHGKDLSKADVAVNIACHIMAQELGRPVQACCAIGDTHIEFEMEYGDTKMVKYEEVVNMARDYIEKLGGFEKLAEWGLF